jgi:hypothetical protein
MSQLRIHNKDNLCNVEWKYASTRTPVIPGCFVHHEDDERSFGIVLSRHNWRQALVLWSVQPRIQYDDDVRFPRQQLHNVLKMPPEYVGLKP